MTLSHSPSIVRDGLVLYLDAANPKSYPGTGTTWYDLSGNGRNCSWISNPSYSKNEVNGYFSTLGNRCTGPASNSFDINNTSGYTIINIFRQNSLINTGAFKFYSSNVLNRGIFSHLTWGNDIVYWDQGGCCAADTRTNVDSGGSQTWNMWAFTKNNSSRKIIKNGIKLIENTSAAADINLSSIGVDVVGSDEYGGNSSTWDAKISCFIVYNRNLSEIEIQKNFNALRGRYGI